MLERLGSTAAPLLAGVSFALVALVLQLKAGQVLWPDLTLLLLMVAGLLLIGSIQAILWADGDKGSWAVLARVLYDVGVLSLIAAVVVLLVPNGGVSRERWSVIAVACLGFVLECIWVLIALGREVRSAADASNIDLWEKAVDPALTGEQIVELRRVLKERHGITTGRQALKFRKEKNADKPLGEDLLHAVPQ